MSADFDIPQYCQLRTALTNAEKRTFTDQELIVLIQGTTAESLEVSGGSNTMLSQSRKALFSDLEDVRRGESPRSIPERLVNSIMNTIFRIARIDAELVPSFMNRTQLCNDIRYIIEQEIDNELLSKAEHMEAAEKDPRPLMSLPKHTISGPIHMAVAAHAPSVRALDQRFTAAYERAQARISALAKEAQHIASSRIDKE